MAEKKIPVFLLIDDDREECEIFHYAAEELSHPLSFLTASGGREALALLEECPAVPDVILLDMFMPRMGGLECLKRIKLLPRIAGTPVIIYSTGLLDAQKEELLRAGADGFIEKTSNIPQLALALEGLIFSESESRIESDIV